MLDSFSYLHTTLTLSGLKRINLISGDNGFGKTTLLENIFTQDLFKRQIIYKNYNDEYLEGYIVKAIGENQDLKIATLRVEEAKQNGYVETLFHRRRYIPELSSNNYMVRQFGARAAMNTPIQGTAADIMKIAMIHVNERLKEEKLNARLILQIHDELLIECKIEEKEEVKKILKESMENAVKLSIPLEVEVSEADNWYDVK